MNSSIGEVCSRFSSGTALPAKDIHQTGLYPVYGGNGIRGYTDTYNFDGRCAIIGRQGALCGNVRYFEGKAFMTEHAIVAVANDKNDSGYLAYKLMVMNLGKYQGQSAQPGLSVTTLSRLPIKLPDLATQRKVFSFLNTLSNKINNNTAIISQLESLAKTIYDYWFLQFEFPNEEGKPYKSSGGKMVWNAELKREIPEGWEAKQIKDIATTNRGISYTAKDLADIGTPILSLASVSRTGAYIPEGIKYFYGEVPSSKELKPYDLIMCNTDMTQQREVIARCIMVPDIFENVITHTHHITKVNLNDDSYNSYFCSTTQSSWFHEYVKGFSSGTNVLGLDAKAFDKIWLPVPDKNTAEKYNKTFMKLQKDKSNLLKQNQELASLRDFLLPMLMNGQITFKDN